jgi:hypothetical protein
MGFSRVAVVQQVHNRQVTHITRSNNTFNQTQYTKHNNKGHPSESVRYIYRHVVLALYYLFLPYYTPKWHAVA